MKNYLNKKDENAIKEYLGLESEWCDEYYQEWKPNIECAIDMAVLYDADYILSSDFGIYDDGKFIMNVNGIIIFKKQGGAIV